MSGIIKKDLYLISGLNSSFFIFLGLFVIMMIVTGSLSMIYIVIPIIASTMAINLLAYDRQCDWDQYAAALPVSRRQTVLARYIVSYSLVLAASIIGTAICLIASRFKSDSAPAAEIIGGAAFGLFCVLLYLGIIIPLTYKYGVEKSRIFLLAIVMAPMLFIMAFTDSSAYAGLRDWLGGFTSAAVAAALVTLTAALSALSYFISASIYEKKEF